MAATAVERRGISIALASGTFGVSETFYRNSPLRSDKNAQVTNLRVWLSDPAMTWGAVPTGKRGRQLDYSDAAIQTC